MRLCGSRLRLLVWRERLFPLFLTPLAKGHLATIKIWFLAPLNCQQCFSSRACSTRCAGGQAQGAHAAWHSRGGQEAVPLVPGAKSGAG